MKVTIEDLQAYLYEQYGSRANEQGLFMKLVEEVGEVAEVLNKRSGRKAADGENMEDQLGAELVDMIHYTVAIAAVNQIDLNEMILRKDRAASVKYHHARNLESFLQTKASE